MLLYFLPDTQNFDPAAMGLGYAFEGGKSVRTVTSGPNGAGRGVIAANTDNGGAVGYWPDKQTWTDYGRDGIQLGRYVDTPILPEHFARAHQLSGHPVTLNDGHNWAIPKARAFCLQDGQIESQLALPTVLKHTGTGWNHTAIAAAYQPLWDAAEYWLMLLSSLGPDGGAIDLDMSWNAMSNHATAALSVNYRVTAPEISFLELFTTDIVAEILHAVIDRPGLHELEKKKRLCAP